MIRQSAKTAQVKRLGRFSVELLGRFELPEVRRYAANLRLPIIQEVGSRIYPTSDKTKERGQTGLSLSVELLGRFELPTSSLPRMRSAY